MIATSHPIQHETLWLMRPRCGVTSHVASDTLAIVCARGDELPPHDQLRNKQSKTRCRSHKIEHAKKWVCPSSMQRTRRRYACTIPAFDPAWYSPSSSSISGSIFHSELHYNTQNLGAYLQMRRSLVTAATEAQTHKSNTNRRRMCGENTGCGSLMRNV